MKKFSLSLSLSFLLFSVICNLHGQDNGSVIESSWEKQKTLCTGGIDEINVIDENIIWIKDQDGYLARTINGGVSWSAIDTFANTNTGGLCALNADTVWCVVSDNYDGVATGLYKTINAGQTWIRNDSIYNNENSFPNFVHFWNDNDGFCAGDNLELYTTSNGGDTWESVSNVPTLVNYQFNSSNYLCTISDTIWYSTTGAVYRSPDKGYTWEAFSTGFSGSGSIAFKNAREGLLLEKGANPKLLCTSNAGENWSEINPNGNFRTNIIEFDPIDQKYVISGKSSTDQYGISYSYDNGQTWQNNTSFYFTELTLGIDFHHENAAWVGGFYGNIFKYRRIADTIGTGEDSVTFIYNGNVVTYGIVQYDGKDWLDRNLGATQVATAFDDAASYGDLFQWGREDDGHQVRASDTTSTLAAAQQQPGHDNFILNDSDPYDWNADNIWTTRWVDGIGNKTAADPCPDGWRVPTQTEWQSALDFESWSKRVDAFNSALRLPSAGYRYGDDGFGALYFEDSVGFYWSSTPYDFLGLQLAFDSSYTLMTFDSRVSGFSVRCVKDTVTQDSISISSPSSGDIWEIGTADTINWTDNLAGNVKIELFKATTLTVTIASTTESDGSYILTVSEGLIPGIDYHIKISSISDNNIFDESDDFEISEASSEGTVTDIDGNVYNTVTIGTQTWMAENLRSLHYNDGTSITGVYLYGNDPANLSTYGRLYTWEAAMRGSTTPGIQGVCPDGYRFASDEDWKILESELGMSYYELDVHGYRGTDQGTQLKIGGSSGFDAVLGGFWWFTGAAYYYINNIGYYWSSSETDETTAKYRPFNTGTQVIRWIDGQKVDAMSVRCVKGSELPGIRCDNAIEIDTSGIYQADLTHGIDQYFKYTAKEDGKLLVSSCGHTSEDTYLELRDSCDGETLVSVDDNCGTQSEGLIIVSAGQSIVIIWKPYYTDAVFDFEISESPIQPGEFCDIAIETDTGNTITELTENYDIWYQYTAGLDGKAVISAAELSVEYPEAGIDVYVGDCNTSLDIDWEEIDETEYDEYVIIFDISVGETYFIQWFATDTAVSFEWTLTERPLLPGEKCDIALEADTGINHAANIGGIEQWFTYEATIDGKITLSTCGLTTNDTYVRVYSDCSDNLIAKNDDFCSVQTRLTFESVAGETYYIYWDPVYTWGEYDWELTESQLQPGDFCSDAITAFPGENFVDHADGADKWYKFTANRDGFARISTCGLTTEDTRFTVYKDCDGQYLASGYNDCDLQSETSFNIETGATYYILWSAKNTSGSYNWLLDIEYPGQFEQVLSYNTPAGIPFGLANDGTNLWHTDRATQTVYKLNPANGAVISSFYTTIDDPAGIAYDGTNLWISDWTYQMIYKVSTSGTILQSFAVSFSPFGVEWDNGTLLVAGVWDRAVYRIDPGTGNIIESYYVPGTDAILGITTANNYLWIVSADPAKIIQYDPENSNTVKEFEVPGDDPVGLTWLDNYFYLSDDGLDKIFKLTLNLNIDYHFGEPSAYGENDGFIGISPYGGTPPYSISWSTGDTTLLIKDLNAGTYTVTITDALNNTATESIVLKQPPLIITDPDYGDAPDWDWIQLIGGSGGDDAQDIAVDSAGNVYITGAFIDSMNIGTTVVTASGMKDLFVAKYNSSGSLQWVKTATTGDPYNEIGGTSIVQTPFGIYVTGTFKGNEIDFGSGTESFTDDGYPYTSFIARYQPDGTLDWVKYDEINTYAQLVWSNAEKLYVVTNQRHIWIKDKDWNSLVFVGIGYDINDIKVTDDFLYVACTDKDSWRMKIIQFDLSGNINWELTDQTLTSYTQSWSNDLSLDAEGNVYITGDFRYEFNLQGYNLTNWGDDAGFVIKADPAGDVKWIKRVDTDINVFNHLQKSTFSGTSLYVWGSSSAETTLGSTIIPANKFFIAEFGTNGNIISGYEYGFPTFELVSGDDYLYTCGSPGLNTVNKFNFDGTSVWQDKGESYSGNARIWYQNDIDEFGNILLHGPISGVNSIGNKMVDAGNDNLYVAKLDFAGNLKWVRTGQYTGTIETSGITHDGDGNVIAWGSFTDTLEFAGFSVFAPQYGVYLIKYNPAGDLLWLKYFTGSYIIGTGGIDTDEEGNIIIGGTFTDSIAIENNLHLSNGGYDFFVAKYDPDGNLLWSRSYGSTGTDWCRSVSVDGNSNILISGRYSGLIQLGTNNLTSSGSYDIFVAKLPPDGNDQYIKAVKAGGTSSESASSIVTADNGDVYISGYIYSPACTFQDTTVYLDPEFTQGLFVAKYNTDLILDWVNVISSDYIWPPYKMDVDEEGNCYVVASVGSQIVLPGEVKISLDGTMGLFVSRFNNTGEINWLKTIRAQNGFSGIFAVSAFGVDNIVVGGRLTNDVGIFDDQKFVSTNDNGFLAAIRSEETIIVYVEKTDVSVPGGQDGSISLTVSGGTTPYTFSWNNGAFTEDISSLYAGTYVVTVTDETGQSLTKTIHIYEPQIQTCDIAADWEYEINQGTEVKFDLTGDPLHYEFYWTMGDGTVSTDDSPYHVYDQPGIYNVCLMVYDSVQDCSVDICKTIEVGTTLECAANFTYLIDQNTRKVSFSDLSSGTIHFYYWNFGDGLSSSARNPEHTYNNPGYYLVSLSVRNTAGDCIDHHAELIRVGAAECKAAFGYMVDVENLSVTFHDQSIGKIKTHFWMFGDGLISTEKDPVHEYAGPGIYEVSLTVMDSSGTCMDYLSAEVQVGTVDCNADFSVFIDSLTNTAYFSNQSMGSSNTCYWLFGDGTKSADIDPVHQFIAPGFYNVSLNVFNDETGCMDIQEEVILIGGLGIGCKADFIYQADESTNTVSFADRSLGIDLTYFWYFGDGSFSTDQHPEHPYPDGGIYNVCLTVYSTGGIQNTRCKYIFAGTPATGSCLAQFIYTVNDAVRTVNYTDKSFGEHDTWTWRFGDNNTSGQQNPEHIFTEAGYYITQLTISKQSTGCLSHAVEIVNVDLAGALKAGYGYFVDTLNTKAESYPVDYIGVSLGDASKYKWSFGDGTYDSTTTTPTHEYTAPGTYEVCLTVYNQVTGAEDTYCELVTVGPVSTGKLNYETFSMLCFPNPADNNCMIILDLPVSGYTELSLYSITGSKLRTIVRETLDRGRHSYELKSSELENGLYIIRLQNNSGTITQMLNVQH